MTALSEQEIREMGLVEVTGPNSFGLGGVLLTVDYIERVIHGYGEIVRTWAVPPQTEQYYMHDYGWLLGEGTMPIHFAERITLPENVMGYIHPLPSVIDCGVLMQPVQLWPGYDNRPKTLITIARGQRVILKKDARIAVATFHYVGGAETPQTRETENSVRRYASMVVEDARKLLPGDTLETLRRLYPDGFRITKVKEIEYDTGWFYRKDYCNLPQKLEDVVVEKGEEL